MIPIAIRAGLWVAEEEGGGSGLCYFFFSWCLYFPDIFPCLSHHVCTRFPNMTRIRVDGFWWVDWVHSSRWLDLESESPPFSYFSARLLITSSNDTYDSLNIPSNSATNNRLCLSASVSNHVIGSLLCCVVVTNSIPSRSRPDVPQVQATGSHRASRRH